LLDHGFKVNDYISGETPLHYAVDVAVMSKVMFWHVRRSMPGIGNSIAARCGSSLRELFQDPHCQLDIWPVCTNLRRVPDALLKALLRFSTSGAGGVGF